LRRPAPNRLASLFASAVESIRDLKAAPRRPVTEATIAAVPVTCGAAIDVPCIQVYPPPMYAE
jgi:hypothetical protein